MKVPGLESEGRRRTFLRFFPYIFHCDGLGPPRLARLVQHVMSPYSTSKRRNFR